jgi:opacity protein-like surface antigen
MRASLFALVVTVAASGLSAAPASAQTSPDFLFGKPRGTLGMRSGWVFARANSDLFTFVENQLTVDRKDFNAPAIGVDLDLALTPRTSAVLGVDFSKASKASEYRDFVDNRRLPINQTTSLREVNLSGSFKFALAPRGREISSRAWVPSVVTPYVGAGGGVLFYQFLQYGDFIDVDDLSVFPETFRSQGAAPSAHVFAGVDVKVWKRLYLSGEGRYLWSKATLDRDFSGFDPIDLAGFKLSGGIHYLF